MRLEDADYVRPDWDEWREAGRTTIGADLGAAAHGLVTGMGVAGWIPFVQSDPVKRAGGITHGRRDENMRGGPEWPPRMVLAGSAASGPGLPLRFGKRTDPRPPQALGRLPQYPGSCFPVDAGVRDGHAVGQPRESTLQRLGSPV